MLQIGASSTVQISGVWIANGFAVDEGAAILNAGNLTLSDGLLNFNRVAAAPGQDARGGSVFNASGAMLTITSNTQVMNSSAAGGAAPRVSTGPPARLPARRAETAPRAAMAAKAWAERSTTITAA